MSIDGLNRSAPVTKQDFTRQAAFSCLDNDSGVTSLLCRSVPSTSWSTSITSIYLNGSTAVFPLDFPNGGGGYRAFGIRLQAPTLTSSNPTSSGTESATSAISTSSASSTSSPAGSSGGSTGLSTGAYVGIGIGIAAALVFVGIGLLAFYLRRKKRNQEQKGRHDSQHLVAQSPALSKPQDAAPSVAHEMGNLYPDQPELNGDIGRHGSQANNTFRYELDGRDDRY